MRRFRTGLVCVSACAALLAVPRVTAAKMRAAAANDAPVPGADAPAAVALLRAGDAALDAGDRASALAAYERVVQEFPSSPQATEARRALRALALPAAPLPAASGSPSTITPVTPGGPDHDIVIRNEPYSLRTSERLRLTTWEKLDFGVTSFIYGGSLGVSLGVATHSTDTSSVVLGALGYTVGSVVFLAAANPDRGDLPLALGIVSYVPMTTLLTSAALYPNASAKSQAVATTVSSVLSIPIAVVAAQHLDLDPGDTQLVRDAGFWGLVLSVTGTMAWGTHQTIESDTGYETTPSTRTIAAAGLVGLYGGLGLGLLAASHSDLSLERVRVVTWGGYGGAVLGALIGASDRNGDRGLWGGITLGALVGLGITLATTSGLDGIPPDTTKVAAASWAPVVTTSTAPTGAHVPLFGLGGNL